MKTFKQLREKALTAAEKKKREEIAKAMERDNPDMSMDKKMAIATATAKRVAEGTKQILAHGGKGKYKVVSDGGAIDVRFRGKSVGKGDYDRGADSFFISIKGERGQRSFDSAQAIADYFAKNKITEEVQIDEANVPKDDLNFVATGGAFGKKRRFPGYVIKKENNRYKAYDEQDKMNLVAGSPTLKGLANMLKPYIERRIGGTWKFEEDVELDELDKKTYASYIKKATDNSVHTGMKLATTSSIRNPDEFKKTSKKLANRMGYISKATDRLASAKK